MLTTHRSASHVILALLVSWAPASAQAQNLMQEPVSSRIRISATDPALSHVTGYLLARDSAELTLVRRQADAAPDTLRVPAAAITSLEVAVGRSSSVGRGAVIGALVLGAAGVAMALADDGCGGDSFCFETSPGDQAGIIVTSAALGAGLGALVGLITRRDRWEPWPGTSAQR